MALQCLKSSIRIIITVLCVFGTTLTAQPDDNQDSLIKTQSKPLIELNQTLQRLEVVTEKIESAVEDMKKISESRGVFDENINKKLDTIINDLNKLRQDSDRIIDRLNQEPSDSTLIKTKPATLEKRPTPPRGDVAEVFMAFIMMGSGIIAVFTLLTAAISLSRRYSGLELMLNIISKAMWPRLGKVGHMPVGIVVILLVALSGVLALIYTYFEALGFAAHAWYLTFHLVNAAVFLFCTSLFIYHMLWILMVTHQSKKDFTVG